MHKLGSDVPDGHKSDALYDVIAYLRTLLSDVDSSLVEAWETLLRPTVPTRTSEAQEARPFDLVAEPRALAARVRAELHSLVRDLAARDYGAALRRLRSEGTPDWDEQRLAGALAPFFDEYGDIDTTPRTRAADLTRIAESAPRCFDVAHVLCDPKGDDLWALYGEIDLTLQRDPEGPLFRLVRAGT